MKIFKKNEIILNSNNIPKHIALIMDGNGRWAKKRGLPRTAGHKVGAERIFDIIKTAQELNIKVVTVYAFSTENWKRKEEEINYIFNLLNEVFISKKESLKKENIKVRMIGTLDRLNGKYDTLKNTIEQVLLETKDNTGLIFNIAFNYGGQDEIIRAIKAIVQDINSNKISVGALDNKKFEDYLMTNGLPDVDLVIRTSGEQRLSNFLLWQVAYSELIFTNTYWPDFTGNELKKCLYEYQKRDRKFGDAK